MRQNEKFDPYSVLEVARDATPETVRAAHRRKAKRTHPDAGGSSEDFAHVQTAYATLSDPVRRAHFDETGELNLDAADKMTTDALSLISTMLGAAIDAEEDPLQADLVAVMRQILRQQLDRLDGRAAKLKRAVERSTRLGPRFRRADGENTIRGLLGWHRKKLRDDLASLQRDIDARNKALSLLEEYEFVPDRPNEVG